MAWQPCGGDLFCVIGDSVITDEMIRDEVRAISEGNFRTAQMQLNSMKNLPSQSGAEATSFMRI